MRPFLISIFACIVILVNAQDPQKKFERMRAKQISSFNRFKSKNDSLFVKFIADSWKKVVLKEPVIFEQQQRPAEKPVFIEGNLQDIVFDNLPEDTAVIMRSFTPEPFESPDHYPEIRELDFSFYGASTSVKYASDFFDQEVNGIGKDALIDFWLKVGKKGYQTLVQDLLSIRDSFNLPDFGFYLLVRETLSRAINDPIKETYYTWFILNKASYVCKMALSEGKPVLLLGTNGKIYSRPYFKESGIYYYAIEGAAGELFTYGSPSEIKLNIFDLSVKEQIDLPLVPDSKIIAFDFVGVQYELEVWYNRNIVDLLDKFPSADIRYSFQSTASRLTSKSLVKSLEPLLKDKNQVQRAKFLLAFVQGGFNYRSDKEQFGEEKIMFPDEFLSFANSDCDDRVVFLAYLFRLFTELEVVAVLFPQHVALAVQLPSPTYGESVIFQGKKYMFCDPTYFNAPLGAVIPDADRSKARILRIY